MLKTGFLILICFISLSASAQGNKPDIVFYIADDLGYLDCPVYGATEARMPNLSRLSKEGMIFNNAFVASPSCAPSRSALLTGLMPARNGSEANHSYPPASVPILTKKLQEAGYLVIAFGKIAHDRMNNTCGFDFYDGTQKDLSGSIESYFQANKISKPVCLLVGDKRPHVPWTREASYHPDSIVLPPFLLNTKETRKERARYFTDITAMDQEIGEVISVAEKYLQKDPVILFSSDHGAQWPFAKWNLYDAGTRVPLIIKWKGKIKAGSRTDALISWVDIFPTLVDLAGVIKTTDIDGYSFRKVLNNHRASHRKMIFTTHSGDGKMNVYPIRSVRTERYKFILNLYPDNYHTNHSDLLKKEGAGSYWDSWYALAKTDTVANRLVHRYHIRPAEEFYDLEKDPLETKNLIQEKTYSGAVDEMRLQLKQWMDKQQDSRKLFNQPYPVSSALPVVTENN